jgi:hypothetical protein
MYALNPAHRRVAHGVRVTAMCWVEGIRPPQPEIRTTRRDAMPFVRCKSSKNVTSRLKKCYSVYESVWEGSNIFARRVTVDEYKVPSKMSTNTSLVRTPSTIPTLRWVSYSDTIRVILVTFPRFLRSFSLMRRSNSNSLPMQASGGNKAESWK